MASEFLTVNSVDHQMAIQFALNTRTGAQNLDDPENLWRKTFQVVSTDAEPGSAMMALAMSEEASIPPGGAVYVAPRLFWRVSNDLDAVLSAGTMFSRIATVDQKLSTFLLFIIGT